VWSVTWNAKLILELARLLKHLDAVVVGVGDDNVLVHAEAEAVRRIELTFAGAELTKLAPVTLTHLCDSDILMLISCTMPYMLNTSTQRLNSQGMPSFYFYKGACSAPISWQ